MTHSFEKSAKSPGRGGNTEYCRKAVTSKSVAHVPKS